MVFLHPRIDDSVRRFAVVHHYWRPVDRGHHHLVRIRVIVHHVVGARPVQRIVGHVIGRGRAGLQMTRQRRRRRIVLDVVRHDRVDRCRQATADATSGPGGYAATLALLSGGIVHKGCRRLLGLERHVSVVVHLIRAVIGRRAGVIRRRLAWARIHGLHLLLIMSLIVSATAPATTCSEHATSVHCVRTGDDADRLLMPANIAHVLVLLIVVIVVVRVMLMMVVMMVRAAEKVRGTHVVLQIAVVVRGRVLRLRHHHLMHLSRLMMIR